MTTFKIIDTETGQSVKTFKSEATAILAADELNERLYQASQRPSDNPIGFNEFVERYRVNRFGPTGKKETDYCRYCDTETPVVNLDLHGYCLDCMPFPQYHHAVMAGS